MAFITLKSENEYFSWILEKNPATQHEKNAPFERKSNSYAHYMWFENSNHVSLFSRHLHWKNPKGKMEYLDYTQYTSGEVYLQLMDSLLRSALNKYHEKDTAPAQLVFTVNNHACLNYAERLPEVVKECITKNKQSKIHIEAPTVKKALEACAVISLLSILYDKDYYINDSQYLKYLKFAVDLTKEYSLLRQIVSFIKSDSLYKEAYPYIENTPFIIGKDRSFDARKRFYTDKMASKHRSNHLLELGCGEGKYAKLNSRYYESVDSIEPDEATIFEATHAVRKIKADDKIKLHHTDAMSYLNTISDLSSSDVLLTEVLEHIAYDESLNIIDKVVSLNPNCFLITLPNHDFNEFYGYKPGEFRHDDHLWEPTVKSFELLYEKLENLYGSNYNVEKHFLGDYLKENPKNCSTFALLIIKK